MEGSITKRAEQVYLVRVTLGTDDNGKRLVHTHTVRGAKSEAEKYLRDRLQDKDRGRAVKSTKMTVGEYMKHWLEEAAKPKLRERTYWDYSDIVRTRIKPKLGRSALEKLSPLAVQAFYNDLSRAGLSPRTVRNVHTVLHSALKQAVRWRLLSYNPSDDVDLPRTVKKEMTALGTDQALFFIEAAKTFPRGLPYLVAIGTGMRPEEYLALKWPDMDLNTGATKVQRTLYHQRGGGWRFEEMKTAGSRRTVIMPQSLLPLLRQHKVAQLEYRFQMGSVYEKQHDLVFANEVGGPLMMGHLNSRHFRKILEKANELVAEAAQKNLDAALAAAKTKADRQAARRKYEEAITAGSLPLTLRPYDLRHSCATILLERGENLKVVSERLGHASITLTADVYAHVTPTMQQAAAEKLDVLFR